MIPSINNQSEFLSFTVIPSSEKESEFEEHIEIAQNSQDTETECEGFYLVPLSDASDTTLDKPQGKLNFHIVKTTLAVAMEKMGYAQYLPGLSDKLKNTVTYLSTTAEAAAVLGGLYEHIQKGAPTESSWEHTKHMARLIDLGRISYTKTLTAAVPLLPEAAKIMIPGSGVMSGVFTGISLLNAVMNTTDFLYRLKHGTTQALPSNQNQ